MAGSEQRYEGHVDPGGPAIARVVEVDGVRVEVSKRSVGPMDNNAYLLRDLATDEAVLIDAANDAERLLADVGGVRLQAIVTTHGHPDHWQALGEVAERTGAEVAFAAADAEMIPRPPDRELGDGDTVRFGEAEIRVLATPGHTPGSVCLLLGDRHLFTGDTLFPGGPGNTFGDAQAFRRIMRSLRDRLFVLTDDTWVYPGHGDDTTLGRERPHLDEWDERGW